MNFLSSHLIAIVLAVVSGMVKGDLQSTPAASLDSQGLGDHSSWAAVASTAACSLETALSPLHSAAVSEAARLLRMPLQGRLHLGDPYELCQIIGCMCMRDGGMMEG